jgi:adenylylsulfate reductase subunit A
MQTAEAIQKIAAAETDPKALKKKLKELESEAWEDFLDMTISQAHLWAATNIAPEEKPSEIAACEPYFIGSHSGASGAWVSGPEDLQNDATKNDYFWGYANMATVPGIFCAGDASGASSHKFSSGSFTEGRSAAKAALKYVLEHPEEPQVDDAVVAQLKEKILKPLDTFQQYKGASTDPNINPHYLRPKMAMFRLQKIMDEYAGGVSTNFTTSKENLERGLELLEMLNEDYEHLAAEDLHELLRCWENVHRTWQGEAHIRTILFRDETRWPGYYYRSDKPEMKDEWKVFVNTRWNPETGEWEMSKKPIHRIFV